MTELLKMAHFANDNRVAEMEIWGRGIEADFDHEGPASLLRVPQLLRQLLCWNDIDTPLHQVTELVINLGRHSDLHFHFIRVHRIR